MQPVSAFSSWPRVTDLLQALRKAVTADLVVPTFTTDVKVGQPPEAPDISPGFFYLDKIQIPVHYASWLY